MHRDIPYAESSHYWKTRPQTTLPSNNPSHHRRNSLRAVFGLLPVTVLSGLALYALLFLCPLLIDAL